MELWHILPVYIICPHDLDIWPIYTKIGSRNQDLMLKILAYYLRFWNIRSYNAYFVAPLLGNRCCHGNHFVPHSLRGGSLCQHPSMKLIGPPGTELRHILAVYITCLCDLDLWPIFPKIGSSDSESMVNICASSLLTFSFLKYEAIKFRFRPRC